MSCWALVPLKTLGEGKTRLSRELAPQARKQLVEAMLERVLGALTESRLVDHIAMVGTDPWRCPASVLHLPDPGRGLNGALTVASQGLQSLGAKELLVMHADLPLARGTEIDDLIAAGRRRQMALASDHHGRGTNALFLSQPENFAFGFGGDSLARHLALATARNLRPALSRAQGLMFDIDTAQDLHTLNRLVLPYASPQPSSQWSLSHA